MHSNNIFEYTPLSEKDIFDHSQTLVNLFEKRVKNNPDQTAINFQGRTFTYKELNGRANQLAHYLKAQGVKKRDALVPILVDRSAQAIIGILGILKAGSAYIPIDPECPNERISYMLSEANAHIIVKHSSHKCDVAIPGNIKQLRLDLDIPVIECQPKTNLEVSLHPDDLAYVIFTSGSTGKPKGVMIEHRGIVNLVNSQIELFGLELSTRVLQFSSLSFDASCSEIFTTLISGGQLFIPTKQEVQTPDLLSKYIVNNKIEVLTLPPFYQPQVMSALEKVKTLISAGECLNRNVAQKLSEKGVRVFNAYGPTENSVCISMSDEPLLADGTVTIGKPLPHVEVFILDEDLQTVPCGIAGEIYVGGVGVARGYLNQPQLTRDKFIPNPFDQTGKTKLYRTGDIGKWLPCGNLEFKGRVDDQVKINGYRIEAGEIEQIMNEHPLVETAVVVVNKEVQPRLEVYYKLRNSVELWPSIAEFFMYDDILYRSMFTHSERNEKYRLAIQDKVKGKVVLEIGPGPEAVLSRLCIDCDAKHVYTVEILEKTYLQAKECIERLGLSDKITVIHSDIRDVTLPEKADYCISEIVGSIGGSEGSAVLIDCAKALLRDPSHMVPERSVTKIAAAMLDESSFEYGFSEIARHYVDKIQHQYGPDFQFRICLKHFPLDHLISSEGIFEDLVYTKTLDYEHVHKVVLEISKDAIFNGFYVWMDLFLDDRHHFDISIDQKSWLPIFFPVCYPGCPVQNGDRIELIITRKLSSNDINPDYFIDATLIGKSGKSCSFHFASYHHVAQAAPNNFYESLFGGGKIKTLSVPNYRDFREYLAIHLPSYMIPAHFIPVGHFPINISGKIDRQLLIKKERKSSITTKLIEPTTRMEKELAVIWGELLGVNKIYRTSDFFALGGDSIKAIAVRNKILDCIGKNMDVADIYKMSCLEELAGFLENCNDAPVTDKISKRC